MSYLRIDATLKSYLSNILVEAIFEVLYSGCYRQNPNLLNHT